MEIMYKGQFSITHNFRDWREMYLDVQAERRDFDIQDETFYFRYKDGTVLMVNHLDGEEAVKAVDLRKVVYMIYEDGDDGVDSDGKTWSFDFNKDYDAWAEHRERKLYA